MRIIVENVQRLTANSSLMQRISIIWALTLLLASVLTTLLVIMDMDEDYNDQTARRYMIVMDHTSSNVTLFNLQGMGGVEVVGAHPLPPANIMLVIVRSTPITVNTLLKLDGIRNIMVDEQVGVHEYGEAVTRCTYQPDVPWNLDRIDQEDGVLDGYYNYLGSLADGNGVTVYLLDTGSPSKHYDFYQYEFGERIRSSSDMFCSASDSSGGCTPHVDAHGHGTYLAGVIASKTFGVAKDVNIMSVKCMDDLGRGFWSDIVLALFWSVTDWLASGKKPSLVNLSIGGSRQAVVNDLFDAAISLGLPVVVSAGNDGEDACTSTPSSLSSAITVASTDRYDRLSWFSNHGGCVDILAPGQYIPSLSFSSDSKLEVDIRSGTSVAAAHVSGALARYMSSYTGHIDKSYPSTAKEWLLSWSIRGKANIESSPSTTDALLNVNRHCGTLQFPIFGGFGG